MVGNIFAIDRGYVSNSQDLEVHANKVNHSELSARDTSVHEHVHEEVVVVPDGDVLVEGVL